MGNLLGNEEMLYHLYDEPELVHELCKIMSDSAIEICKRAEKLGWLTNRNWSFIGGGANIQSMPYNREICSPDSGPLKTVKLNEHWIYDNAQEFESVSGAMWNEFLLEYQKPVLEQFGLSAYGCCENLTDKIPYLKRIKNMRRIAVTPWADTERCAEQLEDKYVISWRPNPADMVSVGFDPDRIRGIVREAKEIFDRYGCFWEVNLKDFISIEGDRDRLANWVRVVRETLEK